MSIILNNELNQLTSYLPNLLTMPDFTLPIYSSITDPSTITNILFIDKSINESDLFLNSLSDDTFAIFYNFNTKSSHIFDYLKNTFTSISRIGFVFHGFSLDSSYVLKRFLNMENFFETSDVTSPPPENFTENVNFIINILKLLNVTHLDFLGCNLAQIPLWKSYFELISSQVPDISIGASTDNTGNITNTSNWVMETTHEDIKNIYFNSNIHSFAGVLIQYNIIYNIGLFRYIYIPYYPDPGLYLHSIIDNTVTGHVLCPNYETIDGENFVVNVLYVYSFSGCTNLTSITLPEYITRIEDEAFINCYSLTSIRIPPNVTHIGPLAFSGCNGLTSITLPENIVTINRGAFFGCSGLTSITIPGSLIYIPINAFYNCWGLTSITILDGVQRIEGSAFALCFLLPSITIPSSINSIGDDAFYFCNNLTSVTILPGATSIGARSFFSCSALTTITIPASVTSIGADAFGGTSLNTIYYNGVQPDQFFINLGAPENLNIIRPSSKIYLNTNWNIIGMSYNFTITDPSMIIFPNTIYSFYNNKFTNPNTTNSFNANSGYYIKAIQNGYIDYNITSSLLNTINLNKGLNMIYLQSNSLISNPNNIIISIYPPIINNTLLKKINYWIKSSVNGQIQITF